MKNMLLMFVSSCLLSGPVAAEAEEGELKVSLTSIERDEDTFVFTVVVKCDENDFSTYYIQRPDVWGKVKFYCEFEGTTFESKNELLIQQGEYVGIPVKANEELTFKYTAKADDGFMVFDATEERLPIFSRKPKLRVRLSLWISNFSKKECWIERPVTNWIVTDFPFKLSEPSPD